MVDVSKKSFVEVMDEKVINLYTDIKQTMFNYFDSAIQEKTSTILYTDRQGKYIFSLRGNGKTSVLTQLAKKYGLPLIVPTDFLKKWTAESFDLPRNTVFCVDDILNDRLRGFRPDFYLLDEVDYGFYMDQINKRKQVDSLFGYIGFVFRG